MSWSFSSLTLYEGCPHKYYLKYIQKQPEAPSPAAERGTLIHEKLEAYLRGEAPMPVEAIKCAAQYKELSEKPLTIEEEWGFDRAWVPCDYKDAWLKMKLDVVSIEGLQALIVDHKTGKPSPIKHAGQGQLYAIGVAQRMPDIQSFKVGFYYVDFGEVKTQTYTRDNLVKFKANFERRVEKLESDTQFKPISNKWNCAYCPFNCEYRSEG